MRPAIVAIVFTDSMGYLPVAVSPESITTSVPSSTALAKSLTSARVGAVDEVYPQKQVAKVERDAVLLRIRSVCAERTGFTPFGTPNSKKHDRFLSHAFYPYMESREIELLTSLLPVERWGFVRLEKSGGKPCCRKRLL